MSLAGVRCLRGRCCPAAGPHEASRPGPGWSAGHVRSRSVNGHAVPHASGVDIGARNLAMAAGLAVIPLALAELEAYRRRRGG
jgi:hypothetical protein